MTYNPSSITVPQASAFARKVGGLPIELYHLKNKNGMQIAVTNYGAYLVGVWVTDRKGRLTSVALGFDSIEGLAMQQSYYGATIGRYANRIAKGKFTLDGTKYTLAINNAPNSLHGGKENFSHRVWNGKQTGDQQVELELFSEHGEEGYPGNLNVKVTYTLTDANELAISYEATTDRPTIVNLTNHAYFNLNGEGNGDILFHVVQIAADKYTPIDKNMIPTGEIAPVKGTPLDFTNPERIGKRINADNAQLKIGGGYDHNYVLNRHAEHVPVATVTGDQTGIKMEVFTDQPGMQFYTGNFMAGTNIARGGVKDTPRTAFAMETHHFPDSPNQPTFPSTVLKPGDVYKTKTTYKFSA